MEHLNTVNNYRIKAARLINPFINLLNLAFPLLCPVCGEKLNESEEILCDSCRTNFYPVRKPVCPVCGAGEAKLSEKGCKRCPKPKAHFDIARSVFSYKGSAGEAVQALKFNRREELAPALGRMAFRYLIEGAPELSADAIVPVPLHPARKRERGFNQSFLIAREIGQLSGISVVDSALIRIKNTKPQSRLDARQRAKNIKNAFAVEETSEMKDQRVLLFDDVYTGGWTTNECAKVLKLAGAKEVFVLTLTRA